jgi:hypothetical protein
LHSHNACHIRLSLLVLGGVAEHCVAQLYRNMHCVIQLAWAQILNIRVVQHRANRVQKDVDIGYAIQVAQCRKHPDAGPPPFCVH